MRTKVLLGLAVLAAGAATSMAQSNVYSLNIVGYCNVPVKGGYSFLSNPLDNGNNSATTLFPNPNPDPSGTSGQLGPLDGCSIQTLKTTPTGQASGYDVSVYDSLTDDTTTGFTDVAGTTAKPIPQIAIGQGFFIAKTSPGTFVWTQIL